jgi:mannose-6-phosphate isomerase-like protein (cupin superfamily)
MDIHDVAEISGNVRYTEFIRSPSLSVGIYRLRAGDVDPQTPHSEDEVYHVVAGSAQIQVGDEHEAVTAGTVIYVAAGVDHRFHSIEENLTVLVFFAPAEYSLAGTASDE